MNSFGRIFRVSIYGESHGQGVGVIIDGTSAGLKINTEDFKIDLERRNKGRMGNTSRIEADVPEFVSGVFDGRSTGAPINIYFKNADIRSDDYSIHKEIPRPGHADLTARQKFNGYNDHRGGGMFSGRMTAGLVAAGVIAKKILGDIDIKSTLIEAGGNRNIVDEIEKINSSGDSIGGIVECRVNNISPGLGEPFFDSVESIISHGVFSVPGIKGIEFGAGFASSGMRGSEMNDRIIDVSGTTGTNNSGGINGGITNGNEIVFRVAIKPSSSIMLEQESINLTTGKTEKFRVAGRHDKCIALRVPVILEAITAIALTDMKMISKAQAR